MLTSVNILNRKKVFSKRRFMGLRITILKVLKQETADNPLSATDIIDKIQKFTHTVWRPSPGSVYPLLEKLEKENLIENVYENDSDETPHYIITGEGITTLRELLTQNFEIMLMVTSLLYDEDFELDEKLFSGKTEVEEFILEKMRNTPLLTEKMKPKKLMLKNKLSSATKLITMLNQARNIYRKQLEAMNQEDD